MKKVLILTVAVSLFSAVKADELRQLPWSNGLNVPERFDRHSSGKVTISHDNDEQATRFDVKFTPGTRFWCAPRLWLERGAFAEAKVIRFDVKIKKQDKFGVNVDMFLILNSGPPYLQLSPPTQEWQTVTVDLTGKVKDPVSINNIAIAMNPNVPALTYWIRHLEFLGNQSVPIEFDVPVVMKATAPGTVFTQGEPLDFFLKLNADCPVKWILTDWQGKELRSGDWPEDGKGKLNLAALPNGYYMLKLKSSNVKFNGFRSFAVTPDPKTRLRNPDTYFALDSAQSWIAAANPENPRHPQDGFATVSEVARRAGLEIVRDRLRWKTCEPSQGKYSWGAYMTNAEELNKRGVKISSTYHDAPSWAKNGTGLLPTDLLATYNFAKKLSETFKGKMNDWEFWNEQDIHFSTEPAWDYASAMKAAYLGFKAGDPEIPVALGAIGRTDLINYCNVMMDNGLSDYIDIFNIHTYAPLKDYPKLLDGIHAYLKRYGIADRPIWFTENGSRAEGPARINSYMNGIKAHSWEQELLVAEFLPKAMIYLQNMGVDRDFFFLLTPFNENNGTKDWGLLRRDFTVKPGYAAFSNLMNELGSAKLEGSIDLGEGIRGFLYKQPDDKQTLVFWSLSELDTEDNSPDRKITSQLKRSFSINAKDGVYFGTNIFGTPFEAGATDGQLMLTATRMVSYVNGLSGLKPTIPFKAVKKSGAPRQVNYDRTVIFRVELSNDFILRQSKDCVEVNKKNAALKLQVWNLSNKEKSGIVNIHGGKVTGLPDEITIPAFGKVELALKFTPNVVDDYTGLMEVGGEFNGKGAGKLVVPMFIPGKLVAESRQVVLPRMLDSKNWRENSSGKMLITFDRAEQAIRFQTKFPKAGRFWVYPEYILELPRESLKGACGIAFEVKATPADGVAKMLVMAVAGTQQQHGKSAWLPAGNPTEDWEERVVRINPLELDPSKIEMLRIGLNPKVSEMTFWIRNIRILFNNNDKE
jgi:hypothetical protein